MQKTLFIFFLLISISIFSQKNTLQLGDKYADDQLYISISYAQFIEQPAEISSSNFSFALSGGFIKDIILNKRGSFSIAAGVGVGADFFNHHLKVEVVGNETFFSNGNAIESNSFRSTNVEFPLELRWRTSNAKKYKFWRIYGGIKFLYNVSNNFQFTENDISFEYKDVNTYNKFQYGATLSAGYDAFNINVFYGLTPIFKDATLNGTSINTKILRIGLIFYLL